MVLNKKDLEKAFSPKVKNRRLDVRSTLGRRPTTHSSTEDVGSTSDVKVYIRIRPFSEKEVSANTRSTIKVVDDKMLVFDPKQEEEQFFFHGQKQRTRDITKKANKQLDFVFDQVFPPEATNNEVFECSTKNIILSLLEGYNCSVFVYGATGAGKTHTMLGNKDNPGITYLTMVELYNQVDQLTETKDFHLGVTYLEVYNENVHNLLMPASAPMHLRDDGNNGVTVAGLKITPIENAEQLFELLEFGNKNRTQHPTDANAESSRSHAVFQVYVKMSGRQGADTKVVKLSMIDLAGSERGLATGCSGSRFKEGSNINKSLLALGNCINNLADGLKHIPYRDSKLTRLLKDSLGGNCQTVMIANISPSSLSYEDTYNTLKYATRAKKIKTRLTKNIVSVEMHVGHYIKMVEDQKREIHKLKEQIKTLERATNKAPIRASPPAPDPRLVEKMCAFFKEKKALQCKLLSLESEEKTLEWRIRHKQLIASQLDNITADENDSLGINRVRQTLRQLEARGNSIREQINETLKLYNKHNQQFLKFTTQLEESKTIHLFKKDMNNKELQVTNATLKIETTHHNRLILMQDKRHESQYSIITNLSALNSTFYLLLKGHNLLTCSLETEYQAMVRMLEGIKGVSWVDIDDGSEEDEGMTFSSASVRPFMNLTILYQRPERYEKYEETEEGKETAAVVPEVDVNSTFSVVECPEVDVNSTISVECPKIQSVPVIPVAPVQTTTSSQIFKIPSTSSVKVSNFTKGAQFKKNATFRSVLKKENCIENLSNPQGTLSVSKTPKMLSRPLSSLLDKTPEPRVPLSTLKMNRLYSRANRSHHPYKTPKSNLSLSTRKKIP